MNDFDGVMTASSTKSSLDSGFDNGFLSDSSSLSSKSDGCPRDHSASCVFEELTRGQNSSYHCCALSMYNISGKCIETLSPKTFLYLANCVRVLDLSKNNITMLPETLCELTNLQELNLSCNKLLSIPDSCRRLQKLQVLNLSENQLTEPPVCLELGMERITNLDLSKNNIGVYSNPPKCCLSLQMLNLSHNCLNSLPLWLFSDQCRSVLELDVSFNFCFDNHSLKSELPHLKHHRTSVLKCLKKLSLCNTGVKPETVSCLSSFECLNSLHLGNVHGPELTFNFFSEIPLSIFYNPENILELHLPKLGLAGLPEEIHRLKNLQILNVSGNQLDWLPETFGLLKSLKELILSSCNLSYLPENFGQLQNLKKLVMDKNKFTDLQSSLNSLSSLEWLDLYDNTLEELPLSYDSLLKIQFVDLSYNYFNLETMLDVEVNGVNLFAVYCCRQDRLRELDSNGKLRIDSVKVMSDTLSWDSLGSLNKHHNSRSFSDLSQTEENTSYQYYNNQPEVVEENWDEESTNGNDEFEPESVHRYHLPLGLYQFGWTPPIKRRECPVPVSQQASGFVFVPGQWHQKTTVRKKRKRVKDLVVAEGQFDDAQVDHNADLQNAESLGVLLRLMHMFVRNSAGVRRPRRCKFHTPYEDCLDPGLWFRLSPPVTFELPSSFGNDSDDEDL